MTNLSGRYGFFHLLGGSTVGRALSFFTNILLSRTLGPAELGLLALILNTSQTFEILSRSGVDYGVTCALTDKEKSYDEKTRQIIINVALRIVWFTSITLLVFLLLWLGPGQGLIPKLPDSNRNLIIVLTSCVCITESLSGLPWDILLIQGKVKIVRLRQGLFVPTKLIGALWGASVGGFTLALTFYLIVASIQAIWLNRQITEIRKLKVKIPKLGKQIKILVGDGLPLYLSNSLSALVFLPLLADIASTSGLGSVGYLRAGQIVVQIFTLIPGALAPILFVKSRTSQTESHAQKIVEKSLIMIWSIGMATLLFYLIVDKSLINIIFGNSFLESLQPTRMLIYVAIIDSIGQVLHTSLLAKQQVRLFIIAQNTALFASALLGWYLIPRQGIGGYLVAKFIFAGLPSLIYLVESWGRIYNKNIVGVLLLSSFIALPLCWLNNVPQHLELGLIAVCFALVLWSGWEFKCWLFVNSES